MLFSQDVENKRTGYGATMIQSVLIANRGEIARRIIRTCKRLGIRSVAIYSEADRLSLHVREADEAIGIGGYTPLESYLVIDKILEAAEQSGAEAIHPGYGFLAENPAFAQAVIDSGRIFIGPKPETIRLLGDKTAARQLAQQHNIPLLPGTTEALTSVEQALAVAQEIGYPVLLKAAAGGGGKGMRVVYSEKELPSAFAAAQSEAFSAFGDRRVFIEKFLERPRHIEIQIIADTQGNVLYFPERECSIQRRHQKVVEESPSAAVTPELREAIGQAAARLAKAAGYQNAGTVEFLMDEQGQFYFMEVNTRLQVEHPVTEMLTGLDLVELQIRIAGGEPLPLSQDQIQWKGHAIECRICAEDVYNNFFPESGIVRFLQEPEGDHIRVDSALFVGYEASVHFDSMVAKLIVWGADRSEAIHRMQEALARYHLAGFNTTIPFCQFVMRSTPFQQGLYSTHFVEEQWDGKPDPEVCEMAAMIAAAAFVHKQRERTPVFAKEHPWKLSGSL